MKKNCGFPNPFKPGEFGLAGPTSLSLYDSRWASNKGVAELVLAGKYDHLTPIFSEFIPTLRCPFHCPTCHFKKPKEDAGIWQGRPVPGCCPEMSLKQACVYLNKLAEGGCQAILLTGGGEPTLHPQLGQIVKHIKSLGLSISMSTNGTFAGGDFEPEETIEFGFTNIRISLDTIEKHASFHGYDKSQVDWCEIVLENIGRIAKVKKDAETRLTICIIFDQRNFQELTGLGHRIATFKGVNSIIIRPVIDYFGNNQVSEDIIKIVERSVEELRPALAASGLAVFFPRYRQISLGGARRQYSECRACGLIGGIWPDGRMFICTETNGFDDFCIGDLTSQTLKEIYSSSRYQQVRQKVGQDCFAQCPATCRPLTLNLIFDRIEKFRSGAEPGQLEEWVRALQHQHIKPCPWIQA